VIRTNVAPGYKSFFNTETGLYARDTDPFLCPKPELLDISITNKCTRACSFCYMNSSPTGDSFMSIENLNKILDQSDWVYQIALGGGEPTVHPQFVEILQTIKRRNICPNYTSNGDNLTENVIEATARYCGAMALSVYDLNRTIENSKHLIGRGIKVNWHWVVSRQTLPIIMNFLKNKKVPVGLNAIIFLLHKPIGRADPTDNLTIEDHPKILELYETLEKSGIKGGFDACFLSWVTRYKMTEKNEPLLDHCDSARYSAYLDWDLNMSPCSFGRGGTNSFSLKEFSMDEIWNNKFEPYRERIRNSVCKEKCAKGIFDKCYSGCPILPINLCEDRPNAISK
jgi:MoaA/NifB/PqqE/SkfB family radical SAM enzyme